MLEYLETWISLSVCCYLSILFVISLYVVDPGLPRNHPLTVRRRICAISAVCFIAPATLYLWMQRFERISMMTFLSMLGLRWNGLLTAVCYPFLLVMILYSGLIFQCWIEGDNSIFYLPIRQRKDIVLRNYLVAPLAEELIFRACMIPVLRPTVGDWAVFISPLFFGLAHVHHLIDWYRLENGVSFRQACLTIIFQMCYTSIFGLFAGFLFVRTRHLISLIVCHSVCNIMGVPPIESAVQHQNKYAILTVYIVGIVGFFSLLFPMTSPSLYY